MRPVIKHSHPPIAPDVYQLVVGLRADEIIHTEERAIAALEGPRGGIESVNVAGRNTDNTTNRNYPFYANIVNDAICSRDEHGQQQVKVLLPQRELEITPIHREIGSQSSLAR